jgi:Cu(I)/Ag(I) efflux system membrane fusion protein
MHPQIREDKPGNCPLCGMELVPVDDEGDEGGGDGDYSVKLSNAAMKIAEVSTSIIERKAPFKEVYLPGKIMPDERNISELTARYPGRIEKLYVNFTGQKVKKGQVLAQIYSPELVTAQKELFEAMKLKDTNPSYFTAVRNKLKLWDLTEAQIDEIASSGEVKFYFDVLSPLTGTVTMRHVALGDYVKEGVPLFEIIDLRRIWVMFDAYESDIPWIKLGDKIKFTIKSIPDEIFESTVTFIDPVINPQTRVAGVRTELRNSKDILKPHMLASGLLKTMLPGSGGQLIIPKSAVLWTGKKAVVYVRTNNHDNMFLYTEVTLGADAGDYYIVKEGLKEGNLVASNGVFKIDAAAQLKGEQSMMNPEGGKVSMAHNHGDMSGDKMPDANKNDDQSSQNASLRKGMVVNERFKKQLTSVYSVHLELQNAFLASDPMKVKESVSPVKSAIGNVDMSLVEGDMHNFWMESLKALNASLDRIKSSDDLEVQRLAYADFNDELYKDIKMFGVSEVKIYYQFCPMARNGEGAYWLSETEEIKNPYYGEAMLTCGETIEVIQ